MDKTPISRDDLIATMRRLTLAADDILWTQLHEQLGTTMSERLKDMSNEELLTLLCGPEPMKKVVRRRRIKTTETSSGGEPTGGQAFRPKQEHLDPIEACLLDGRDKGKTVAELAEATTFDKVLVKATVVWMVSQSLVKTEGKGRGTRYIAAGYVKDKQGTLGGVG